ncbi:L-lactate permease [Paenibacillus sambharensis]|uniref:L-lactate permease n=1 Tax=Paenibacillus sambharensis TaxID=1803190 RepID=A0A2W1LPI5_9BACL|nr:L-lactate permease [Paenibacillus sambharensis]PZD96765.1 L-lactate permease [Paenibacillus sambharensis]
MSVVIALLPIILIFILLFFFKLSSLRVGVLSLLAAVAITALYPYYHIRPDRLVHASVQGSLTAFVAAYVLFFGILLFHLMNSVGGIQTIASYISQVTRDHSNQALLITAGLSPLIESTSGFGIAFMMVAPIFLSLGFSPMRSALLGLVSLLAVPWGALATGTVIGAGLGGISLHKLGAGTALLSIPVFLYFMAAAVGIAGGRAALKRRWKEVLLYAAVFAASMLLLNQYVSVELAGVLSSLLTLAIGISVMMVPGVGAKTGKAAAEMSAAGEGQGAAMGVLKAVSPYVALTVLIFISRLWTPFKEFLESHAVIRLPAYSFSMALLYSPGFWLLVTCLFTVLVFRINGGVFLNCLRKTLKQWVPFTISTAAFVSMSEVMAEAGMTALLAGAAGALFGSSFLLVSPLIGGIGGFLTGSNTGSNAMFIKLQIQTAGQAGLPADLIAYSQNASSSHSTMACPSRVMLGASLCGIQSEENQLLKTITLIAAGAIALIAFMVLAISLM